MSDTVVITAPDPAAAVLAPTVADAIAASQMYWLLVQNAEAAILAAEAQTNISATEALTAAASALSAAAVAGSQAAAQIIPAITVGTATIQTRARIQRALNNAGLLQTANDYVQNNYTLLSDTAIEWSQAPLFPIGGLVYIMLRAAIPYTDLQARALWAAALALSD
jgi:hypothetical protein